MNSLLSTASDQLTLEFPNLFHGTEIVYQRYFEVFGLKIYWYGVLITVGIIIAYIYAMRRVTRDFGIVKDRAFDVVFAATIGGFLCARIYYCVFRTLDPNSPVKYNFITMFTTIRDGGIAIYGGIIGALVVGFIVCKIRKVKFLAMADLAMLGFLIGQTVGRWGNYINQEAYGDFCDPDWIFGMTGSQIAEEMGSDALVHPCFLYESTWCLLGFIFLHIYSKKLRTFDGEITLLYVAWYGFGRMFIEGLRTDSLYWGSFRVSQILAAISCAAALILFVVFKIVTKKKGTVLYVNSEESKALIEHDLEVERQRKADKEAKKAKKNGAAPSILGDDADNSEKPEETAENAPEGEEKSEETTAEETAKASSDSEAKTEEPAAEDSAKAASESEVKPEETAEDSVKAASGSEEKSEETAEVNVEASSDSKVKPEEPAEDSTKAAPDSEAKAEEPAEDSAKAVPDSEAKPEETAEDSAKTASDEDEKSENQDDKQE